LLSKRGELNINDQVFRNTGPMVGPQDPNSSVTTYIQNSRNLADKIYRGGTEEFGVYKFSPNTNRNANFDNGTQINNKKLEDILQINHKVLFNHTQGLDSKTFDYSKPQVVRKKSMNKQSSKNSMLFNLVPSHGVSVDSSSQFHKKKKRKSRQNFNQLLEQFNQNTTHSNSNNIIIKNKNLNSKLLINQSNKSMEKTNISYSKGTNSSRYHSNTKQTGQSLNRHKNYSSVNKTSGNTTKKAESASKYKPIFAKGLTKRKKKKP